MKKTTFLNSKTIVFLFLLSLFASPGFAQQDTLHLNYIALQPKMPDSTEAKITAWVKKLNGRKVYLQIFAYYNQSEFKKYSTERSEEVNLIILRKARDLVTITKNEVRKGAKSQRSKVDIVYILAPDANAPSETTVIKTEEKTTSTEVKNEKVSPKETTKKESTKKETANTTNTNSNNGTNNNQTGQPTVKEGYYMDSVYVNGVLKVTKRKIKKN